jgi:beta-ureidopropionase
VIELRLRIAAIQLGAFKQDYTRQMGEIERLISAASRSGADIICLPELMTVPYFARSQDIKWRSLAEPLLAGETYTRVANLAKNFKCTIIATCYESRDEKRYNTAFAVDRDGSLVGKYEKTHVPYIEALQAYETLFFDPGTDLGVFEIRGVVVGILICYDRSFPEAWRTLALKGAQVIFVPTSSSGFRGGMYVEELKVAAAQHQVFVVAANKSGEESLPGETGTITFYGKSNIINPFGNPLVSLDREEDAFIATDIDLDEVSLARRTIAYYRDRRSDLYRI